MHAYPPTRHPPHIHSFNSNVFHGYDPPMSDSFVRVVQQALFLVPANAARTAPPQCFTCVQPITPVGYCHYDCHCGALQEMGKEEFQAEQHRVACFPRDNGASKCPKRAM